MFRLISRTGVVYFELATIMPRILERRYLQILDCIFSGGVVEYAGIAYSNMHELPMIGESSGKVNGRNIVLG